MGLDPLKFLHKLKRGGGEGIIACNNPAVPGPQSRMRKNLGKNSPSSPPSPTYFCPRIGLKMLIKPPSTPTNPLSPERRRRGT
jgi:hypothetical protein